MCFYSWGLARTSATTSVLAQVICWVLGEYGTLADIPVESVIDKMAAILDSQKATDSVRGYLVTAFGKLCSQAGCRLTPQAEEVLHDAVNSRNLDLQQHALEINTLLRYRLRSAGLHLVYPSESKSLKRRC